MQQKLYKTLPHFWLPCRYERYNTDSSTWTSISFVCLARRCAECRRQRTTALNSASPSLRTSEPSSELTEQRLRTVRLNNHTYLYSVHDLAT
ncbi:hypothetical protein EVAR_39852_1 [Eumeta japonica]|uniref:Uncharacterized protein n=1 Tax=Eumeta variegata TaxID=151549 RepID=A0A4C1WQQ4_EUMVA|nr:hypothetical protein EVAR_39852_1 [Eumeta japonica]